MFFWKSYLVVIVAIAVISTCAGMAGAEDAMRKEISDPTSPAPKVLPDQVERSEDLPKWEWTGPWLVEMPKLSAIRSMDLVAETGGYAAVGDLANLLQSGELLKPNDPLPRQWAFAPLCRGQFVTDSETYKVVIYRGGLAWIKSSAGRAAFVKFEATKETEPERR